MQKSHLLNRTIGLALTASFFAGANAGMPAQAGILTPESKGDSLATAERLISARSFIKARIILDKFLATQPNNTRARLDQAQLFRSVGLFARSRQEYEQLYKLDPSSEIPLIALSEMALESLNPRQALQLARQAVAIAPHSLETHMCLVSALIATNAYQEAESVLSALQSKHPNNAKIDYLRYKLALKRNQLALARNALERSVQLDSSNWQHLFELSELCKNVGDYESAKKNLKRVLAADPGSADALTKLAVIDEFNFHDYQQAIEHYQKILASDPDSVTALAGIDRCKHKSNDLAAVMKDAMWRFFRHSKTFSSSEPPALESTQSF